MATYSQDLRDRVLDALERGECPDAIAQRFVVSKSWVYKVRDRFRKDGVRTALRVGGYRHSRIEHLQETISSWIQEQPDLTLAEMCARLSELGIKLGSSALWDQLANWGLTLKKNSSRQRAGARRRAAGAQ